MSLAQMLEDLPNPVVWKKGSKGCKSSRIGYKLHIDAADGAVPISCILTSASIHDSQVGIPFAMLSNTRVINLHDLMDSAYALSADKLDELRAARLSTQDKLKNSLIKLIFLLPYAPSLSLIE
jgi:hypothetical protein